MGKIKTKIIKRTTENLIDRELPFNSEFEHNKKILGRSMPSKKMRNQIAGYMARLKRQKLAEAPKALKTKD